jgi:heat shock factor-binding protein 1
MAEDRNSHLPSDPNESTSSDARPDVTAAVDELLTTLSAKFAQVSSDLFNKMDDMSRRIDKLEAELIASKPLPKDGSPSKPQ